MYVCVFFNYLLFLIIFLSSNTNTVLKRILIVTYFAVPEYNPEHFCVFVTIIVPLLGDFLILRNSYRQIPIEVCTRLDIKGFYVIWAANSLIFVV